MKINSTFIMDLLRKSTLVLIVLILPQVLYYSDRPVVPKTLEEYTEINGTDTIRFSADSGFYEEGFSLEMEAEGILPKGAQIRYTMDGSEPDIQSPAYDGPIRLDAVSEKDHESGEEADGYFAQEWENGGYSVESGEEAGGDLAESGEEAGGDLAESGEEADGYFAESGENADGYFVESGEEADGYFAQEWENGGDSVENEEAGGDLAESGENADGYFAQDVENGGDSVENEEAGDYVAENEDVGEGVEVLSSGDQAEADTSGAHYAADNPAAGTAVYTVRAKIICGEEETGTQYAVYGIGRDVLPGKGEYIVCVDTEDANLYDYDTGILVGGRDLDENDGSKYHGNYMQRGEDWVRPCHVAIFDGEGKLLESRSAGMAVSGGMSRRLAQKSLNLAFGEPWCGTDSDGHLGLDIFPDLSESEYAHVDYYTHLRLRARSQVPRTFREALVSELAGQSGDPAVVSARSGIVFLNGSFYTLAELEPTFSNSYLAHRFNLPDTENIEKIKGKESSVFRKMNVSELFAADLTKEENRRALEAAVDMDDYLLYYAINVLDNNLDWPRNNVEAWRYIGDYDPEYPCTDGRLRFTVFDSDKAYYSAF